MTVASVKVLCVNNTEHEIHNIMKDKIYLRGTGMTRDSRSQCYTSLLSNERRLASLSGRPALVAIQNSARSRGRVMPRADCLTRSTEVRRISRRATEIGARQLCFRTSPGGILQLWNSSMTRWIPVGVNFDRMKRGGLLDAKRTNEYVGWFQPAGCGGLYG